VTGAEIFGERIRVLRSERGLSQERLAGKADLTTGFVNAVEHGRKVPSLTTILKLARALDVDGPGLLADFDVATIRKLKL
jgi:transcriptional regulator with XRE-family HTH domain